MAVRFPTPSWARSAVIIVSDAVTAIVYWAHRSGSTSSTLNCSIANGSFDDPPTKQVLGRTGHGDLLIAPAPLAISGVNTRATVTYRTCPYPYVEPATVGTITVTFSSRALPVRRRS